jgi:Uma2 family endonuclease
VSSIAPVSGLTYETLPQHYPTDDGLRRELIDGELYVTPAPSVRHQRVVLALARALADHADRHGGECFVAPLDVYLGPGDVPEPDVVYLTAATRDRLDAQKLNGPPDLVIEVASPSTRRMDLLVKRRLFERTGVPCYWIVDLQQDAVVVHLRRGDGTYGEPEVVRRGGGEVRAPVADGLMLDADAVLGPPSDHPDRS